MVKIKGRLSLCINDRSATRRIYIAMSFIIVLATFALRGTALSIGSIDWDEGLYLIMAQRWLLGGLPYVAIWDQHPPGLPALLALVQMIVPDPVIGARLVATVAAIITALVIQRFCVRYLNQAVAGLIAALLYSVCMSRWLGLAANTEVFNNMCVTIAAYLLYGAAFRDAGLPSALAAALFLGLGLQIKYVVFPEAVLLCSGYLLAKYQRNRNLHETIFTACLLVIAGCLPSMIAVIYFWANGAWLPFIDANIGSNIAYLHIVPNFLVILSSSVSGLLPIMGALMLIAYVMLRGIRWRCSWSAAALPQAWILLWTIAAGADVCLPLKFFTHYYFALYPSVCIAGGLSLSFIAKNQFKVFIVGIAILFLTALPLWIIAEGRIARSAGNDASRNVAAFLQHTVSSDAKVFVYHYNPVIYALARLRPPTAYALGSELADFTYSSKINGETELHRIMDAAPDFVVIRTRLPGEAIPVALDAIMARSLSAYHLVYQVIDGEDGAPVCVYKSNRLADNHL